MFQDESQKEWTVAVKRIYIDSIYTDKRIYIDSIYTDSLNKSTQCAEIASQKLVLKTISQDGTVMDGNFGYLRTVNALVPVHNGHYYSARTPSDFYFRRSGAETMILQFRSSFICDVTGSRVFTFNTLKFYQVELIPDNSEKHHYAYFLPLNDEESVLIKLQLISAYVISDTNDIIFAPVMTISSKTNNQIIGAFKFCDRDFTQPSQIFKYPQFVMSTGYGEVCTINRIHTNASNYNAGSNILIDSSNAVEEFMKIVYTPPNLSEILSQQQLPEFISTCELKPYFTNYFSNENIINEIEISTYLFQQSPSNFLPITGCYMDTKRIYMTSKKVNMGSLLTFVNSYHTTLHEHFIQKIIKQIVQKLKLIHDLGICHRDISLENILIELSGDRSVSEFNFQRDFEFLTIFLCDFGQAVQHKPQLYDNNPTSPMTPTSNYDQDTTQIMMKNPSYLPLIRKSAHQNGCGKTFYMSPELSFNSFHWGNEVSMMYSGFAVDSWQLGILTFVLLTKQFPFAFNERNQNELHEKCQAWFQIVKNQHIGEMEVERVNHAPLKTIISPCALEFLELLLQINPTERANMDDLLTSKWMITNY